MSAVHVVVDATMIKRGQAGLRSVATGLVSALSSQEGLEVTVVTLADEAADDWGRSRLHASPLRSGDPFRRNLWREARLPGVLRSLGADVLLVPAPEALRRAPVPQVLLVHDLGPLMAPAVYGRARYVKYLATLAASCRRADQLVCVSSATELDLLRWTAAARGKTRVAHNALQVRARDQYRTAGTAVPSGTTGVDGTTGYTLCVGAALAHKNLEVLLKAYEHPAEGMPPQLVLAGPDYAGEVARLMSRAPRGSPVSHLGFLPLDALHDLYRNATVFAMPSLYEGFGIPVLEAMSFGVPVVVSDVPALREAGGDVATYVSEPLSPQAWRRALAAASTSEDRCSRAAAGVTRVTYFSWERMADTVRGALEDARWPS